MVVLSMVVIVFLMYAIQTLLYRKFWAQKLNMKIEFSSHMGVEGQTLFLAEELTNAKLLPLPWVLASFQVSRNLHFLDNKQPKISDDYYQNDLFCINMYQRVTRRLAFVCAKRGYYRIKSMSLSSTNLLGTEKFVKLFSLDANCGRGGDLTVLPKPIAFSEIEFLFRQLNGSMVAWRFINPDPFEFKGIRVYEPEDDIRFVNYKATAKTNQLMVNVHAPTATGEIKILLNVEPYTSFPMEEVYEEGIRLAATVVEHYIERGFSVSLISNGCDIITKERIVFAQGSGDGHFQCIAEGLARLEIKKDVVPFETILQDITEPELFYICIGSHDGDAIRECVDDMEDRGLSVFWIIPAFRDQKLREAPRANRVRWEVLADDRNSR